MNLLFYMWIVDEQISKISIQMLTKCLCLQKGSLKLHLLEVNSKYFFQTAWKHQSLFWITLITLITAIHKTCLPCMCLLQFVIHCKLISRRRENTRFNPMNGLVYDIQWDSNFRLIIICTSVIFIRNIYLQAIVLRSHGRQDAVSPWILLITADINGTVWIYNQMYLNSCLFHKSRNRRISSVEQSFRHWRCTVDNIGAVWTCFNFILIHSYRSRRFHIMRFKENCLL